MTPAEAAAFLRRYNEWRRTDDRYGLPYPDPRKIGEAIDVAVEIIERLEAAEKSDAESLAMYRKARDERDALHTMLEDERKEHSYTLRAAKAEAKQVDTLRAKIAEMEKQEPVAFGLYSGWALKATYLKEHEACEQRDRRQLTADLGGSLEAYRVSPLYALPGAQPAPSVPDGWKLVPIDPTLRMLTAAILSSHAINVHRAEHCYRAMLAAAPEAKP